VLVSVAAAVGLARGLRSAAGSAGKRTRDIDNRSDEAPT